MTADQPAPLPARRNLAEDMVDWDLAVSTARRLMKPGPAVTPAEAAEVVGALRRFAAESVGHVRAYTQLAAPSGTAPAVVVDRAGWVQANADGMRTVLRPLVQKLRGHRGAPGPATAAVGSRLTGLEAGGLFAFLSNKVLGQFDPFFEGVSEPSGGRMLLVAPNIVHVERELGVVPAHFRLWVCLHEETHRTQFTAVPWLRRYLLDELAGLVGGTEVDPARLASMAKEAVGTLGRMLRGGAEVSLLDLVQTPEQRERLERLTAVMSLLEGHADVVMDGVGPAVVPSVDVIRERFDVRRGTAGTFDQLLRRLLGFDAKLRQYRDGAAFVRGALAEVGVAGFNAVWEGPDRLPTPAEIADPAAWVRRVHG
ncbi:MAG TPA: zinc-dependent metalloprotease [Nocardioidaceae bacterium]|nr:zinc-dependent metalloprotease [Nocardioidaceae bacterium]